MSDQTPPKARPRPLSPHLQVYKLPLSAWMSIAHRITGVGLSVGLIILTWWLYAAMSGAEAFAQFQSIARHPVGLVMLFGWTLAMAYHMLNGVRHLIWDTGAGLTVAQVRQSGFVILLAAVILNAMIWYVAGAR